MPKPGQSFKQHMQSRMHAYKAGEMHSGSKHGPVVHNPKQAIAIGLSEARAAKMKGMGRAARRMSR